ncbi:MAG: hypothetical protein AMXMBFR59_12170 [Rhodanobacteraceae bacterium]
MTKMPESKLRSRLRDYFAGASAYERQLMTMFVVEITKAAIATGAPEPVIADFQQTPHDPLYGDMMLGTTKFFALEFKSHGKKSLDEETRKWNEPLLSEFLNRRDTEWRPHADGWAMAQVCHLLISGGPPTPDGIGLVSSSPYMPAVFPELGGCMGYRSNTSSLAILASRLLKRKEGASPTQILQYFVRTTPCRRSMNEAEGEGSATLIVAKLKGGQTVVTTKGRYVKYCKLLKLASADNPEIIRTTPPKTSSRKRKVGPG